ARTPLKILVRLIVGQRLVPFGRVLALARAPDLFRVDIGGPDGHPNVGLRAGFPQRHGNGVWLFARGGGTAPDRDRLGTRSYKAGQNLEVMLLAKEGRVVDRERIHEVFPL